MPDSTLLLFTEKNRFLRILMEILMTMNPFQVWLRIERVRAKRSESHEYCAKSGKDSGH